MICDPQNDYYIQVENHWSKLLIKKITLNIAFLFYFHYKRTLLLTLKEAWLLLIYMKIGLPSEMKELWLEELLPSKGNDRVSTWETAPV